jgi:hypothetical protein
VTLAGKEGLGIVVMGLLSVITKLARVSYHRFGILQG